MKDEGPAPTATTGAPTLIAASLRGLCPRCGAATLFSGLIKIAPTCRSCSYPLGQLNVDDGPAAFLILIVGTIVAVAAILVELRYAPAWWVHLLLWVPLTLVLTLIGLRLGKAALAYQEYHHDAGEGRLVE